MKTSNRLLFFYSQFVILATLGLIFLGALVTSNNAGMSVPDWPTTFNYNMFAVPFQKWLTPQAMAMGDAGVFWEHSHRLLASFVGLLTTALAVWIWVVDSRRSLRVLGTVAFFLVIAQGILGGLRVTDNSLKLAMIHGCVAQAFLCLLIAISMMLSARWKSGWKFRAANYGSLRTAAWILFATIYVQLIVAAIVRHEHAWAALPQFPLSINNHFFPQVHNFAIDIHFGHRMLAAVISVMIIWVAALAFTKFRHERSIVLLAMLLIGLTAFQISLGAHIIWLHRPPVTTTLHVVNGALILGASLMLALRLGHFQPRRSDLGKGESARSELEVVG
jgi:cytochrome c oxidase assembly protein subunit 15